MLRPTFCLALLVALAAPATAQDVAEGGLAAATIAAAPVAQEALPDPASAPAYYLVARDARLLGGPGGTPEGPALPFRDAVRLLASSSDGAWALVQHGEARGWLPAAAISNLWIRIDKSERTLYLYRGAELVRTLAADVAPSDEDKVRRASRTESEHHRIPEGTFYVTRRNDRSEYYLAFVLSYPNAEHAMRGLREGLISEAEYATIVRAQEDFREPPMGTKLGGMIEIHGNGSGRRRAWTRGCIALRNVHMDELWETVQVGTPVVVER